MACGSAFISTTLFQLDLVSSIYWLNKHFFHDFLLGFKAWGNFDGNFFVIVNVVALSIMCILPYCWFATVLSLQLRKIGHDAYESIWYNHPPYLQIYFRWIIIYGQIPRDFDGYNIFRCSLDVFMKVDTVFTVLKFEIFKLILF